MTEDELQALHLANIDLQFAQRVAIYTAIVNDDAAAEQAGQAALGKLQRLEQQIKDGIADKRKRAQLAIEYA